MNDFAAVLAPKSDQINAQDLIAGDMTVTIEAVKINAGQEQPVSIKLRGMEKVWRPCKTTGRILMAAWGPDTSVYTGRSVQLYLDPDVKWGGMKVGGIRIRAMSHINGELKLALAESKQNRKIFTVRPLAGAPQEQRREQPRDTGAAGGAAAAKARKAAEGGTAAFREWFNTEDGKACRATGELTAAVLADCKAIAEGADNLGPRLADDPFAAVDTATLTAPTDEEIQRQINEDHQREMARLDEQP
jgi:hypothetical protein